MKITVTYEIEPNEMQEVVTMKPEMIQNIITTYGNLWYDLVFNPSKFASMDKTTK